MKKGFFISLLLIIIVITTGCGNTKEPLEKFTCTMNGEIVAGTTIDKKYTVTYRGEYVETEEQVEILKSDNQPILAAYKSTVEALHSQYKNVKYYDYKIDLKNDTLTTSLAIDYTKVNTDKLIEVNSANSNYIKDGKVTVSALKQKYKSEGASCE